MVTGNKFRFTFGNVERSAARFSNTCDKEAEESHRLSNNAPNVVFLPLHDIRQVEGTGEEQDAHKRKSKADFVADGHGACTESSQEAVLGLGSPTSEHGTVSRDGGEAEQQEHAHIGIDDGTCDADRFVTPFENHRSKPRNHARGEEHDSERDSRRHKVQELVHASRSKHFLEEQLCTIAHVLHIAERTDLSEVRNLDVGAVRALTVLHKASATTFHRD